MKFARVVTNDGVDSFTAKRGQHIKMFTTEYRLTVKILKGEELISVGIFPMACVRGAELHQKVPK